MIRPIRCSLFRCLTHVLRVRSSFHFLLPENPWCIAIPFQAVHQLKVAKRQTVTIETRFLQVSKGSQGGLVVINRASHLCDPSLTLASVDLNLTPRVFLRVPRFSSLLKIDSQSITSGWVCGAPRSHMDRMAVGALTCIRSDPVEPVDPEKPL